MPLPFLGGGFSLLTGGSLSEALTGITGIKTSYHPADLSKSPYIELYRKIMTLKNENGNLVFSDYGASLAVRSSIGDMPNRDDRDRKEAELAAHYWSEAKRFMALPINKGDAELIVVADPKLSDAKAIAAHMDGGSSASKTVIIVIGVLLTAAGIWYLAKGK